MSASDFEYDGKCLSEFGYTICEFDYSSGTQSVSAGSTITFNTVSKHSGKRYGLAGTKYEQCITASFDICKNTCDNESEELTVTDVEFRELMRWLNRREFLKFRLIDEDGSENEGCYYNASFNIEKIVMSGTIVGIRLNMETDSPFGYAVEQENTWTVDNETTISFNDESDEIGFIYPNLEITCQAGGTLELSNIRMATPMVIENCSSGETIYIDGENQIITSSISDRNVLNDFNFHFFRIVNTYDDRGNTISSSIPCTIKMTYSPIIKGSV